MEVVGILYDCMKKMFTKINTANKIKTEIEIKDKILRIL